MPPLDSISLENIIPQERRSGGGPSDVEWALLVREVSSMKATLTGLSEKMDAFIKAASEKCDNCSLNKRIDDHESRIRTVESLVYKALGIAAVGASLLTFFLNKVFN